MTLTSLCALTISLLALVVQPATRAVNRQADPAADAAFAAYFDKVMTYPRDRNPAQLAEMMKLFDAGRASAKMRATHLAFGEVFAIGEISHHPEVFGPLLVECKDVTRLTYLMLLKVGQHSGDVAVLEEVRAAAEGLTAAERRQLDPVIELKKIEASALPISSGNSLDILWTWFFATGDRASIDRICETLVWTNDSPGAGIDPRTQGGWHAVQRAARWSLKSNSRQFPEVYDELKRLAGEDNELGKRCATLVAEIDAAKFVEKMERESAGNEPR